MAFFQSKQVASKLPLTETDGAGDLYERTAEFIIPAGLAAGDIIEMNGLPAYHTLSTVEVLSEQIDSNGSPTATFDVDFLTGTYGDAIGGAAATRTMGSTFFAAATAPIRAGGTVASAVTALARQVASTADRGIGLKLVAGAATLVVGAHLRLRVRYTADIGDLT
jgi:hypothetical protein